MDNKTDYEKWRDMFEEHNIHCNKETGYGKWSFDNKSDLYTEDVDILSICGGSTCFVFHKSGEFIAVTNRR